MTEVPRPLPRGSEGEKDGGQVREIEAHHNIAYPR
jgi:hypothetical protein